MAMTLRLTDEEDQALSNLASALHVSKQEAAVRAIQETWTRHGVAAEVEDFADYALRRYRDLLDRLAQ
jgi:predicted transcriptional regulator